MSTDVTSSSNISSYNHNKIVAAEFQWWVLNVMRTSTVPSGRGCRWKKTKKLAEMLVETTSKSLSLRICWQSSGLAHGQTAALHTKKLDDKMSRDHNMLERKVRWGRTGLIQRDIDEVWHGTPCHGYVVSGHVYSTASVKAQSKGRALVVLKRTTSFTLYTKDIFSN